MKKGYIYKITSPSDKIYIGQTVNLKNRKNQYSSYHCKNQIALFNSIKKYSWDKHIFEIIEEHEIDVDKTIINEREKYWISFYDSFRNGLNCNEGGNGNTGFKFSEETKKKMSETRKEKKQSEETKKKRSNSLKGKNNPNFGKKISQEQKEKTKESKLKNPYNHSEEIKNKISIGIIGNTNGKGNKGRRCLEETKNKLREIAKLKKGYKTSSFGTYWINKENKNKRIKKEDLFLFINNGWVKGKTKN